jgi:DNA polymerase-3 subunit gamma/tau
MYQVLARKYRPRNFNELVGQNHVSRALSSALERGRLHHAYLFTGTRGVGKTTIARILAKCLNCETGVTSTPCEVCATCKAVNEGRFIDLIEIDAASRTKVEDTRELLDNVPYAPTQGRFKVYLIDEVHMLSTHSFNALLKTLEEPPEHVKFLFATTDPQKLPITVISRCLQFTLRPLAVDEITKHLGAILEKEQITADQDAIWQIAESAQGSLRDALSLTDQAIAYGQGSVHHQDVKEMLGLIDRTIIYDLILAIHQNQREKVSQLLLQFRHQALDVSLVLDQLISTLHELAILQYLPDLSLKYSDEINRKIMQLSKLISAQDLQLYYQIACKGRSDLQLAVTQEQGFEMCVLRLLAFRPLAPNEIMVSEPVQQNGQAEVGLNSQAQPTVQEITPVNTVQPVEVINQPAMVEPEPEPEPEPESKPTPLPVAKAKPEKLCPKHGPSELPPQFVVVLDTSGSMNLNIHTPRADDDWYGQVGALLDPQDPRVTRLMTKPSRLHVAKQSLERMINNIQPEIDTRFMAFQGCNRVVDYGLFPNSKRKNLIAGINGLSADQGTPLAQSLVQAAARVDGRSRDAVVVMFIDGEDNCQQDVCAVSRQIAQSQPRLKVNVVNIGENALSNCIAENTGGRVYVGQDAVKLRDMLRQASREVSKVTGCP